MLSPGLFKLVIECVMELMEETKVVELNIEYFMYNKI